MISTRRGPTALRLEARFGRCLGCGLRMGCGSPFARMIAPTWASAPCALPSGPEHRAARTSPQTTRTDAGRSRRARRSPTSARGRSPTPTSGSCGPSRRPPRGPIPTVEASPRAARLARDRLERAPAPDRDRRHDGQLRRDRQRAADRLRPRPRRLLAELAREPPRLRRARLPRDRARPARLRRRARCRRLGDLDAGLRAPGRRLRAALGLESAAARRQLDRRLHRGRDGDRRRPTGPTIWSWSPPPESATRRCGAGPSSPARGCSRSRQPLRARFNAAGLRRPGVRQAAFRGVMRHPQKIRRELLYEFFVPAMGSPGFCRRGGLADGLRLPRPARARSTSRR